MSVNTPYENKIRAFQTYGMEAAGKLAQDNAELFLSIPEEDAFKKVVALTRLRDDIPTPRSTAEAYDILSALLGELLRDGQIQILPHGLSTLGQGEFNSLVALAGTGYVRPPKTPAQEYADVVEVYRTNPAEFNRLRASDPSFLARSNEAQSLKLLTQ